MTDETNSPNQDKQQPETSSEDSAKIDQLRQELLSSPPEVVIANHCFGLFELAAIYLSNNPPRLRAATLAIDALAAIADSLKGRLGEHEQEIADAAAQLRLAYIQVSALEQKPKNS